MAIIYRDEKLSNLTPAEVDNNFREVVAMIDAIVIPAGVNLVSFSIVGPNLYANLSDASVLGPYPLPHVTFTWREAWAAGTVYELYDVFEVPGDGVYLVVQEYTAPEDDTSGPAVFDPDVENTEGPLLQKMFGTPSSAPLLLASHSGANLDYTSDYFGRYVQIDNDPSTSGDPTTITVGLEADTGIVAGQLTTFRQKGTEQFTFIASDTSIIINSPESLTSRKQGSTVTLIYLGGEEYDLAGDLELI
jgi:hypothetical protein